MTPNDCYVGITVESLQDTTSDEYGDFKIGLIYKPEGRKRMLLKIVHRCNQYNTLQIKYIVLPPMIAHHMKWNTWESVVTVVPLLQGNDEA